MSLASDFLSGIHAILDRDLTTLRREVEAYPDERELWRSLPGISNSAGTLALHLAGNLQHFLGTRLGGTGYVRNRDAEFSRRNVARAELLDEIEAARAAVNAAFSQLSDSQLTAEYPEVITENTFTTSVYLMHLSTHFAYHLGQIDYHRRIVTGSDVAVGAVRPSDLSSARPARVAPR